MNRNPSVPELDCVDVREALVAGRPLSIAEAEHAAACPVCSQALPGGDLPVPSSDILSEVEAMVGREKGPVAWLRSLPTPVRISVGVDCAALFAVGMALTRPRWAFGPIPVERVTLVLVVLAAVVGLVVWLALRPLQSAPPSRRLVLGALAAGILVPVFFALTPPGAEWSAGAGAPGMLKAALSCFIFGAIPGILFVLALRALDRTAHRAVPAALLAAVGGGLAGNAALELHCPSVAPVHLLLGHATVGIALLLAYGALRRSSTARDDAPDRAR